MKTNRASKNKKRHLYERDETDSYFGHGPEDAKSWRQVLPADTFNPNVSYAKSRQAKTLLNKSVRAAQQEAGRVALRLDAAGGKFNVSPQLSWGYCGLPLQIGTQAAIGHTALLEYQAMVGLRCSLRNHLKEYLERPFFFEPGLEIGEDLYKQICERIVKIVDHRVLLEDLQRHGPLNSVEYHRLALASVRTWQFRSLPEIVEAVVMFGDIVPDWLALGDIHPGTQDLLRALERASFPYLEKIALVPSHELSNLGKEWFQAIMKALLPFLAMFKPVAQNPAAGPIMKKRPGQGGKGQGDPSLPEATPPGLSAESGSDMKDIDPLNKPVAPSLLDPPDPFSQAVMEKLSESSALSPAGTKAGNAPNIPDLLKQMLQNLRTAAGQVRRIEDTRSDILRETMRRIGLEKGPIEGSLIDGHEIRMDLGNGREGAGEIFDRPIDIDYSPGAYFDLKKEARPVTTALKRMLYPNFRQMLQENRFNTSGALDGARLPSAMFSDAVFKRYRSVTRKDPKGKPVLLIVCDGSGSMGAPRIRMLKIITFAFLTAASKSGIRLLAGLYNQGFVKPGVSGNLVQWLYHPRKTPAVTRTEAARTVANLPDSVGSGGQADALAISFMVDEAIEIARGSMVYMVLITDCGWCHSFRAGLSPQSEVHRAIEECYEKLPSKFDATLVALDHDSSKKTGFEEQLDGVINISDVEMNDPRMVADKIGRYVATQIRERRTKIG